MNIAVVYVLTKAEIRLGITIVLVFVVPQGVEGPSL